MAIHEVVRVEIELASDLEPISGQVRMPDARARSFTGVLELINLLDEARAQPGAEDSDAPGPSRDGQKEVNLSTTTILRNRRRRTQPLTTGGHENANSP